MTVIVLGNCSSCRATTALTSGATVTSGAQGLDGLGQRAVASRADRHCLAHQARDGAPRCVLPHDHAVAPAI